jgi:acetyltransferase-like isoleucine patch superfamily enzyme
MRRRATIPSRLVAPVMYVGTLALYARLAVLGGLALWPGVALARVIVGAAGPAWYAVALAVGVFAAYFTYTVAVLGVVGTYRFLTRARSPLGRFPYYSWQGFQWARYNSLILLVRHTCLDFMRLTPFMTLFHRLMGMRLGARVQINTPLIFDSNLIEIGDDTVIGGDATLIGHVAEGGRLVTGRVRIGNRVTVGLKATILPDVEIADGATIAPHSLVVRGTRVGPGELWGGAPATRLGQRRGHGADAA